MEQITVPEWVYFLGVPLALLLLSALGKWTANLTQLVDFCMGTDLCLAALGVDVAAIFTWFASPNDTSFLLVATALIYGHIVLFMGICNLTRTWQKKGLLLVSNMLGLSALFSSFLFLI